MSTDKISNAYKAMGQELYKPKKQKTITWESLGISIKGADTAKRKPSALQKMAEGYRLHKEQLEARTKEMEKANAEAHAKAIKTLKNNTKGADK